MKTKKKVSPLSSPQVSVQLVTFLMMGSAHASPARWASTSQNQAVSCASPVEEAS